MLWGARGLVLFLLNLSLNFEMCRFGINSILPSLNLRVRKIIRRVLSFLVLNPFRNPSLGRWLSWSWENHNNFHLLMTWFCFLKCVPFKANKGWLKSLLLSTLTHFFITLYLSEHTNVTSRGVKSFAFLLPFSSTSTISVFSPPYSSRPRWSSESLTNGTWFSWCLKLKATQAH